MIYTLFTLNCSGISDLENLNVTNSTGDTSSSSNFSCSVNNEYGRNKNTFSVGDEVKIYASTNPYYLMDPDVQWQFSLSGEGVSGANSMSINSEIGHLTAIGYSGVYYDDGKIGSALHGKSGGYMFIDNNLLNLPAKTFTISLWTKNETNNVVEDLMASRTNEDKFLFRLLNGSVLRSFDYTGGGTLKNLSILNFQSGVWNYVCYIRDDLTATLYYNGSQAGQTTTISGILTPTNNDWYFMAANLKSLYWKSGLIDDLRFYHRAISTDEMLDIYNSGLGTEDVKNDYKIFNGIVEDVKFTGKGIKERIDVTGRDYSARMMDRTVEPEVYNNLPAGSIVKDIINKYCNELNTGSVQDGTTIQRIRFNHTPVYDAVSQLADNSNYIFYVDKDKYLHFEDSSELTNNVTLNSGNVLNGDFKEQRDTIFNQVWVYGDRYLDGFKETLTAGSPVGGSVFTLLYKPHNTIVTVSGALIQPGGILDMLVGGAGAGSNVKYLISYEDRQVIFTSGTSQGANIPASGNSVVIQYDRDLPIVKVGDDETSKAEYGTRVKVIQDKQIKDPNTAELIMTTELNNFARPTIEGNLQLKGIVNLDVGKSVTVNLPNNNVINEEYDVIETKYDFSKSNILNDSILKVKLNGDLPKLDDKLKEILLDLKKLKTADMSDTDILTRYQRATGSIGIYSSGLEVWTQGIGSSFILGHWGTGSYIDGGSTIYWASGNGVLGSTFNGLYDPGLSAYFKLNECGSVVTDLISGVWLSGVRMLTGGITFSSGLAQTGSCIELSGLSYYKGDVNQTALSFTTGSPFSVSAWVNVLSGTIQENQSQGIFGIGSPLTCNYALYLSSGTDGLRPKFTLRSGGFANRFTTDAGDPLEYGVWHNLVGTYDGGSFLWLYRNGSLIKSGLFPIGSEVYTGGNIYIGGPAVGEGGFGSEVIYRIDECRIYRYALPVGSIMEIYNNLNPGEYSSGAVSIYSNTPHFLGDWRTGSSLIYSE
jgi:hypothetical protein